MFFSLIDFVSVSDLVLTRTSTLSLYFSKVLVNILSSYLRIVNTQTRSDKNYRFDTSNI